MMIRTQTVQHAALNEEIQGPKGFGCEQVMLASNLLGSALQKPTPILFSIQELSLGHW